MRRRELEKLESLLMTKINVFTDFLHPTSFSMVATESAIPVSRYHISEEKCF